MTREYDKSPPLASATAQPERLDLQDLPVLGIGVVACEEFCAAQLGLQDFDGMKAAIQRSAYWPEFCRLAKAGSVPENWVPGILGKCVLGWAKGGE